MKYTYKMVLCGCLIACWLGCNNDDDDIMPCPPFTDLGTFDLLADSKSKFPYATADTYVVLSDMTGNEVFGEISTVETAHIADTIAIQCPRALNLNVEVVARNEQVYTTIEFPDLGYAFDIRHRVAPLYGLSLDIEDQFVADLATIVIYELGTPLPDFASLEGITVTIDRRSWPFDPTGTATLQSSVLLDGQEYLDVYTAQTSVGNYRLYYSFAEGLIGFEDLNDGTTYKFERIE
jgi:hypothetical protein